MLSKDEIRAILRAADELISTGGRSMLVKILKGSKDKKVLEYGLQECPAYGFYHELTMEEISHRVDWMIRQDYLRIDYNGRLPIRIDDIMKYITNRIHDLYWKDDINCARTMLICLSELFKIPLGQQTIHAAVGLHGAGGYRAQCGLVEGALLFIGIYYNSLGKTEKETVLACYNYASAFEEKFGSLKCFDLRPTGFTENDPPHMCEEFTCVAVEFAYQHIAV
ncbi:MAG: RQC-minor-1 family DNA-binding protein [Lachnospiraceae bacterium]